MDKKEFEQLKSTVKQWLFHTGSLDPVKYANELKQEFIEPREKQIEKLKQQIGQMKNGYNCKYFGNCIYARCPCDKWEFFREIDK